MQRTGKSPNVPVWMAALIASMSPQKHLSQHPLLTKIMHDVVEVEEETEVLRGNQFPAGISDVDLENLASSTGYGDVLTNIDVVKETVPFETQTEMEYQVSKTDEQHGKNVTEFVNDSPMDSAKSPGYEDKLDDRGIGADSTILAESMKADCPPYEPSPLASSEPVLPEPISDSESNSDIADTIDKEIILVSLAEPENRIKGIDFIHGTSRDNENELPEELQGVSASGTSSSRQATLVGSPAQSWQESDEQFVQVSLQESQPEIISETPVSSSLLGRIGFSSFGHEKKMAVSASSDSNTQDIPSAKQSKRTISFDNLDDSEGSIIRQRSSSKTLFSSNSASPSLGRVSSLSLPLGSPYPQRVKVVLPNASPELMRLIDSAIQGSDLTSLEKLKHVVAEEHDDVQQEDGVYNESMRVVDVLLAKMGALEGQYDEKDSSTPRMMLSVGAALVAGELIPWLCSREPQKNEASPRTRIVKGLDLILKACTRNRSMCCDAGLLQVLIRAAQKVIKKNNDRNSGLQDNWKADALLELLAVLGSHRLTVQDLRKWLGAIADAVPMGCALDLLLPLEQAINGEETRGPSHTFEFDGESSGLLGPGESRWPFINGYAFATWLYIESFADTMHTAATAAAIAAAAVAKSGKSSAMSAAAAASALAGEGTAHMPRLFSFLSADNQGIEAYFHGQFLVVESAGSKGKKASLHFSHSFNPRQWYFIGVEHSYRQSMLGKTESEVKLYVDGHLCDSRPLEFPRVSKPLAFCCIGTNPPATMAGLQRRRRQCPLFAEMGPVYIFKEPIGEDKMGRLADRWGDCVPAFGFGAGLPSYSRNDMIMEASENSVALDMDLEASLHLLYHPKLLMGRSCPDSSPAGAAGTRRRPAEVLGHVHVAARIRPVEALWAMGEGGPLSLLPLAFGSIDTKTSELVLDDPLISAQAAVLAAPIIRIIALSLSHSGNVEELLRGKAPQMLAQLLAHILCAPSINEHIRGIQVQEDSDARNEEVVAAVILLAQAASVNHRLKVQLYSKLLLDFKLWGRCSYGLQKKLLSSLADMVFSESETLRAANAVQMLLDGCRKCYWIVPESDSLSLFAGGNLPRPIGELNALVEELLVVVELLLGTSRGSISSTDVQCLVKFLLNCPQPNQVARFLRLFYRLIVQPNTTRATVFAENFVRFGGVEMLLTLLQRESDAGEEPPYMQYLEKEKSDLVQMDEKFPGSVERVLESNENRHLQEMHVIDGSNMVVKDIDTLKISNVDVPDVSKASEDTPVFERSALIGPQILGSISRLEGLEAGNQTADFLTRRNIGGISLSITADSAKNDFQNIDKGDGIVVGIIGVLGALISGGHLRVFTIPSVLWSSNTSFSPSAANLAEHGLSSDIDGSIWLMYALQKVFQSAQRRLLTDTVYEALLAAVIRSEAGSLSSEDGLNLYESFHSFDHTQLLAVLLRALPHGSKSLQIRALQDILFLACVHSENRIILTAMAEWPEWLLEILISNYEHLKVGTSKLPEVDGRFRKIEDLVYNFLMIMLEHSLRQKDGWKDVEATIHCAEWLAMIGGSSTGELRQRREEMLPVIKRKLLGGLLEFAARELQLQTQVVAAAAANVVAEGLSPKAAKAEADAAAYLSMALAENAIVLLMLVEDHLRLQCQIFNSSIGSAPLSSGPASPRAFMSSASFLGLSRTYSDGADSAGSRRFSATNDSGGLSLDVLASMADSNGQISASAMERLTAAAAAEPYESVRCAFVSYGTCGVDLIAGWKRRSRMWYGVGLPARGVVFGGGGSGWDSWLSVIEKGDNGEWIELPLVKKSMVMLQALLVDASGIKGGTGGFGYGGGAMAGAGGLHVMQQLLDSDQPFFTMLRMVLVSMREEDNENEKSSPSFARNGSSVQTVHGSLSHVDSSNVFPGHLASFQNKTTSDSLLWCVLASLLTMPLTESRRQRVLVSACIMYSEVWHAVSADKKVIRKKFLEMLVPPLATLLRRWRPMLCGIHELTDADGQSPLAVEDRALAIDARPLEAAAAMVTPEWAAAFASPPAAMALAMAAAGAGGGDFNVSKGSHQKRELSAFERKTSRLRSFATFQKPPESTKHPAPPPKDKAGAKAAAMAAARDQERAAKIGSGRGLGAVAMASSAQRRANSDRDRAKRWGIFESMNMAWSDFAASPHKLGLDISDKEGSAASLKLFLSLSELVETSKALQHTEAKRCMLLLAADENDKTKGMLAWQSLVRRLLEMKALFGPIGWRMLQNQRIFWKMDSTENALRMRKRLKRNYKGTDHHGAAADYTETQLSLQNSKDSACAMNTAERLFEGTHLPAAEATTHSSEQALFEEAGEEDSFQVDTAESEEHREDRDYRLSISSKQSSSDDHNVLVSNTGLAPSMGSASETTRIGLMDPHEKFFLEIPAVMVQPLRVLKGFFQVTSRRIIFAVDDDAPIDQPEVHPSDANERQAGKVWPLSALREVHSRRYLLRRSALELFMVDRSNFFFNFTTTEGRRKAYKALVQARPPLLNNIYAGTQKPEQLLKRMQLMERWARWEISNFEYLMQLNTLAGRSYNDITQYPVFPWILADYSSESLNLENPEIYRDLTKPVGALNSTRLEKFLERYENFDDPVIPQFHYGSHYSTAGTVLYYLVRVEPFTTLLVHLQGGKFDHADRMFLDMESTWNGVLEDMSDVKELVPELFYLPEVLMNVNGIDLGKTQKGEQLGDVRLPHWATSPLDFIQKHRAALESQHVSAHLHHWIDLIFGYKQQGKEAVMANNMFFYMTYEGAVDIDKIADPVIRKGTQDQIAYFGQTPSQLLSSPHMKRMPLEDILHLQTIFRNPLSALCYPVPSSERCNVPASAIGTTIESVIVVDMNAPACSVAVHKWQPHTPDGHGLPFQFQHGKPATSPGGGALVRMFSKQTGPGVGEWRYPRALALSAPGIQSSRIVALIADTHLLTGGHADNSLKLVASDSARTMETALGHCGPISCVSLSPDGSICLTGSYDCTAMVWCVHSFPATSISSPTGKGDLGSPNSAKIGASVDKVDADNTEGRRRCIEGPLFVLRGHTSKLVCCCVNADLDVAVSCSQTQGVLLHSITKGRLIRSLPLKGVEAVALSSEGILVVWDKMKRMLSSWTINGICIASMGLKIYEGDVTSIIVSADGHYIVIGTSCIKFDQPDMSWYATSCLVSDAFRGEKSRESQEAPACPSSDILDMRTNESGQKHGDSTQSVSQQQPAPAIILLDIYTLQVLHKFKLHPGQDVTGLALNRDSTNLVVSTSDKQLFVYTDPALSLKVVDRMLRLGWQGAGLAVNV